MKSEDKVLRWFYLALLALVWGSSFILMKRGLLAFEPDQMAALRMFASFIALFPFVIPHVKKVKKENFKYIFATGILGNGIPAFLFAFAQTKISSSMAGMLNSLTPVFVVILGLLIFKSAFKISHILGVIIGLGGAVSLILVNSKANVLTGDAWYGSLVLLATICYAFSVSIIRHYLHTVDSLFITGFALFAVGIPCGIYLFSTDFVPRFATNPQAWSSFGYIITLALLGTALSTVLFNKLVKISNALYASSVTYLIPIVAVMWGFYDGESLHVTHFLAMGAILTGVYLINYSSIKEMRTMK